MKAFNNPPQKSWKELCSRPQLSMDALDMKVRDILARVKEAGDEAIKSLTLTFDKTNIADLRVPREDILSAASGLSDDLMSSMKVAAANIEKFHSAQKRERTTVETMQGVKCWRKAVPVEKVGIYIPGGSAPLFSTVLMLGIPAKLAGCSEVILCTPPGRSGSVNPAILFAAQLVGIDRIFRIGGAQAIGAMAYGTASVPQVYKIFGPGNQFVTRAKQLVSEEGIAIDMPAGPSELLVIADEFAEPSFIAADLLSQAEHGEDSQVVLVVNDKVDIVRVQQEISSQLQQLPRMAIAMKSLANSRIVTFPSEERAMDFVNAYAPEHLIINTNNATVLAEKVINAGSVFLGSFSPESAGDYASGTNHTLPTNGYARASAGVSLESFLKYITFQEISAEGLQLLGPVVEKMAEAESLAGHKMAVSKRLEFLNKN